MVSVEFWPPGSSKFAKRFSRPWPAAKAGLMVCWMVFDCGYKISSLLYQDDIYIYLLCIYIYIYMVQDMIRYS